MGKRMGRRGATVIRSAQRNTSAVTMERIGRLDPVGYHQPLPAGF
jgi:hypothetical protein